MDEYRMECPYCGKKLTEGIPFCPYCGKKQPQALNKDEVKKNPYEILEVSEEAEKEVIEAAYKSLARKYHPDSGNPSSSQEKMEEINWAHGILSNPEKLSEWKLKNGRIKASTTSPKAKSTINQYPDWINEPPPPSTAKPSPPKANYQSTTEPSHSGFSFGWIVFIAVVIGIVIIASIIGSAPQTIYPTSPPAYYPPNTPIPIHLPTNTSISYPSSVTIKYTNKCNVTMNTAIYYQNVKGNWVSEGWWVLSTGETNIVANTINPTFYTYSESSDNNWIGDGTDTYQYIRGSQNTYGFRRKYIQDWNSILQSGGDFEIDFTCQ